MKTKLSKDIHPGPVNIGEKSVKDIILSHHEADAASPFDNPTSGEEDPGSAVDSFVEKSEKDLKKK